MTFFKLIITQCIVIFSIVCLGSTNDKVFNSQIAFNVEGEGFHRTINYQVQTQEANNDCHVALFLQLPAALYVNINELPDLQKLKNTTACCNGETDVELFAEDAKVQEITMCSLKSTQNQFSITVHQRYQRARADESYVNVTLPKPRLLFGCKARIKEYPVSAIDLCEPCVDLALKWREIPYDIKTEDYTWIIPVGNVSQRAYVTYITLFISLIGTIFILRALWNSQLHDRTKNE